MQVLIRDCYFTSAQAGQIVAAFSYGEDKVESAVKVGSSCPQAAGGLGPFTLKGLQQAATVGGGDDADRPVASNT